MMLSFLYWHLLHSSLSWVSNHKETLQLEKICVSEMAVEVGISLVVLDAIPRNLRVSPYNRDGAIISFPLEFAASSSLRLEQLQMVWY